ncbi:hypothetical protein BDC45DRAFT_565991 [Circinella umbellata]|nr:hypothetical protein BDC45DRAFT_565991 [Circinella umbellata]
MATKRKSTTHTNNILPEKKRVAIATDWETALRLTQHALENEQHDTVIEQSSRILDDLQQKTVYMLKLRMTAWDKKGRYDNQLQDAKKLMAYAPHDLAGYLYAGQRYSDLGYQKRAIKIFEEGLNKIPFCFSSSSSLNQQGHYQELQQARLTAKRRDNYRRDMLVCLPYDVSCCVLDELSQQTLAHCTRVSSTWRNLVLNYPNIWHHMDVATFDVKKQMDDVIPVYRLLPTIADHIQELVLPEEKQLKDYLDLIRTNNFRNLCSLQIKRGFWRQERNINYETICSSLINVASTLTSLNLDLIHIQGLDLARLLSMFRNLASLRYYATWDQSSSLLNKQLIPFTTSLTKLDLWRHKAHTWNPTFTVTEMQQLIRSSPHLQFLSIYSCTDEIYDEVTHYCPDIRKLIVNQTHNEHMTADEQKSVRGLKTLLSTNLLSGTAIKSLLTQHAATLHTLQLDQEMVHPTRGTWQQLFSTVTFHKLVNITISKAHEEIIQQLDIIIQQTLHLEMLFVAQTCGTMIPDGVFNTLVHLLKFKKLWLIDCDFNPAVLVRCLDMFSKSKAQSALVSLDISGMEGTINDTLLKTCARIKSLVDLSVCHSSPRQGAVQSFARNVAKLPNLEDLSIYEMPMTENDIQVIGKNRSICRVTINASEGITQEQVLGSFAPHVLIDYDEFYGDDDNDNVEF